MDERTRVVLPASEERKLRWSGIFADRVRPNGACLEYTGYIGKGGYGNVYGWRGQPTSAHRVSWQLWHDEFPPPGMVVMHTCDNRKCVRPQHLLLGSYRENMRDMVRKGRGGWVNNPERVARGERVALAKLTAAQVIEIRNRHATSDTSWTEFAAEFGVSRTTVRNACDGLTWKHIPFPESEVANG